MTITKANILTELNSRLIRVETDIDKHIKAALYDITTRFPFIYKTDTFGTTDGVAGYNLVQSTTQDFRSALVVKIDDGEPLTEIQSWADYQTLIAEQTASDEDEPVAYIIHQGILYLWHTPDVSTYVVTIYYSALEYTPGSIGLNDIFEELVILRTCYQYLKSVGMGYQSLGRQYWTDYLDEITKLKGLFVDDKAPKNMTYSDI